MLHVLKLHSLSWPPGGSSGCLEVSLVYKRLHIQSIFIYKESSRKHWRVKRGRRNGPWRAASVAWILPSYAASLPFLPSFPSWWRLRDSALHVRKITLNWTGGGSFNECYQGLAWRLRTLVCVWGFVVELPTCIINRKYFFPKTAFLLCN